MPKQRYPWLSSYPRSIDWDTHFAPHSVCALLDRTAFKHPDRTALSFLGYQITFGELRHEVDKVAKGLHKLGVQKGTHVGLFLPNCPHYIIAYYAILRLGGVVVNFSPLYSHNELLHQVKDSDVEFMVTLNMRALYGKVKPLLGTGRLRHIIAGSLTDVLPFPKRILFRLFKGFSLSTIPEDPQHSRWHDLLKNPPIAKRTDINPQKDLALLQYTGGTTGTPKAAMLTHHNVYSNAVQCSMWFEAIGDSRQHKMLAVLPFFHVFAMTAVMNFALFRGIEMIIHPRFVLKDVLKDIAKQQPTLMPGVPTMFNAILNAPKLERYDLSSLRYCISGGAPLPVELKEQFETLTHCTLIEGYGLTETSPVACANPIKGKNKAGSIGLPLPGTIVAIEDPENPEQFLLPDQVGELCISGPQVMKGYWKQPGETQNVLDDHGKLYTGDLAKIDKQGYVYIVDRIKEMIIAGGMKIYPRTIEEVLYTHPNITEAAIIGIPDDYRGQTVKACIVSKNDTLDEASLTAFLKDKVGKHELPTHIVFYKELPKTMIGKIDKKVLVQEHLAASTKA